MVVVAVSVEIGDKANSLESATECKDVKLQQSMEGSRFQIAC